MTDLSDAVSKILQDLGKYRQMLDHAEIPLEIIGMDVNPKLAAEGSILIVTLGPKFACPNNSLELDEVQFIVRENKN